VKFQQTLIAGLWLVETVRQADERGWFCRTWDADEFHAHGIDVTVAQCNASFNHRAGTLRGLHYQEAPFDEGKLVRCVSGAVFDVVVDLRPESVSYRQWVGVELSSGNGLMMSVPVGCAHGYQVLTDGTELHYQMSARHSPDHHRGVRWDDPAFGIRWPDPPDGRRVISERDRSYPDFRP